MTVNQASKLDRYPIQQVEDLLATLAGGKSFMKLDMSQTYQQLVLDEKSNTQLTHIEDCSDTQGCPLAPLHHQVCFRGSWRASSSISQV